MSSADHDHRDDHLAGFERRLTAWRPASPSGLDRDRLLFEAGRAAASGDLPRRLGRVTTFGSLIVALGLGIQLVQERGRRGELVRELAEAQRLKLELLEDIRVARIDDDPPGLDATQEPANALGTAVAVPRPPRPIPADSYLALSRRLAQGTLEESLAVAVRQPDAGLPSNSPRPILSPLRTRGPARLMDL